MDYRGLQDPRYGLGQQQVQPLVIAPIGVDYMDTQNQFHSQMSPHPTQIAPPTFSQMAPQQPNTHMYAAPNTQMPMQAQQHVARPQFPQMAPPPLTRGSVNYGAINSQGNQGSFQAPYRPPPNIRNPLNQYRSQDIPRQTVPNVQNPAMPNTFTRPQYGTYNSPIVPQLGNFPQNTLHYLPPNKTTQNVSASGYSQNSNAVTGRAQKTPIPSSTNQASSTHFSTVQNQYMSQYNKTSQQDKVVPKLASSKSDQLRSADAKVLNTNNVSSQESNQKLSKPGESGRIVTPDTYQNNANTNVERPQEFTWCNIDGHVFPTIPKDSESYIAVRMVEEKLLSHFPNTFPQEIKDRPPLMSVPMNSTHMALFNSLNRRYNLECPTIQENDVMVTLAQFTEFYNEIKKYFPSCVEKVLAAATKKETNTQQPCDISRGWLQINNTVIPFVKHGGNEFLPVEVITNAAKLAVESAMTTKLNKIMCDTLNDLCRVLNTDLKFDSETSFIPLHILKEINGNSIKLVRYLPSDNPKKHAKYVPDDNTSAPSTVQQVNKKNKDENGTDKIESPDSKKSPPKLPTNEIRISQHEVDGKRMLCLCRSSGTYVLVEALFLVFFAKLNFLEFLNAYKVILASEDFQECTTEEQNAFEFLYGLPKGCLKCNKIANASSVDHHVAQLRLMFQMSI